MKNLTQEQETKKTLKNLKKIYRELPILAETIPSIKTDFSMRLYGVFDELTKEEIETNECGTNGCGLGNSARIFKLVKSDFHCNDFSYRNFCRRILPSTYDDVTRFSNGLWDFLFAWSWHVHQPTFEQFIQRVKYAIDMDLKIGQWEYQRKPFIKK